MLLSALEQRAAAYGPADDYWYPPRGIPSATGMRVDEQTALKISVFWRAVSIVAGSVAKLPLQVFVRRADGGKTIAREHPLARILTKPNERQNGFEWREQGQSHLLLRGNFYNRILPGSTAYPIGGLEPIHPDLVRVLRASNGNPVYEVRDAITGVKNVFDREQIWHVHGLSLDGITGLDVITYAREGLGLTLGAERAGAQFYGQGMHFDKVFKHPGKISPEAAKRLTTDAQALYGGLANVGKVPVLQEGMEVQQLTLTQEQAQALQTREYQAADCARWVGVPNHMVGLTTKSTSWGSGIEQMSIGFVVYTLFDWLRRWEASIGEDLIVTGVAPGVPAMDLIVSNDDRFFAEFNVDGLLRGDTKTRHAAYQSGLLNRYYTRNEVRAMENLNPIPGGDIFDPPKGSAAPTGNGRLEPGALRNGVALAGGGGLEGAPSPGSREARRRPLPEGEGRGFVEDAAARVARKEQLAMGRISKRYAGDEVARTEAVRAFYAEYTPYVQELLHLSPERAESWCRVQEAYALSGWEGPTTLVEDLVQLALQENER